MKNNLKYISSIEEISEEELCEIKKNIEWFSRFSPLRRLEIAKNHIRDFLYLKKLMEKNLRGKRT